MKKGYVLFILTLVWLSSCTVGQDFPTAAKKTEGPPLPAGIQQQKMAWLKHLNNGTVTDLGTYYLEKAGLLWGHQYFQDAEQVATQWDNLQPGLGTLVEQRTSAVVRQDDSHYMELGYYKFSEQEPTIYAYATAWKQVNGNWLRELEVVQLLFEQQEVNTGEIDRARKLWVERSNAHDHEALVSLSYTSDAFYVNQGQSHQGTAAISERYSYMSQPNWQIELTKKSLMKVQNDLAFELGQYQSNGIGHYLIIWEKQGKDWMVLLDFNF